MFSLFQIPSIIALFMLKDILIEHGDKMVGEIRTNIVNSGENASGETAESVRREVEVSTKGYSLSIIGGRKFFPTVETGSKPSSKKPSPEMVESLKDWAEQKSIKISPWGAAINILRHGSKLWQLGGRRDIYTNVKEHSVKPMFEEIVKFQKKQLIDGFNSR